MIILHTKITRPGEGLTIANDVIISDVISHVTQHPLRLIARLRIRRPHVSREEPQHIPYRHLIEVHLILSLLLSSRAQVLMRPGMRRDLVALGMHAFDDLRVPGCFIVDRTLPHVIARDEKGRFGLIFSENVEDFGGVNVRAIVECEGNVVLIRASVDAAAAVADVADVGTGDIFRVGT